ncbi:arsenate reductase ArsC [bacterium]|nr:arsenate reductase ArsC [Candidatus Omnitrophota bacterium]MBU2527931.1 arsenate reductase ArsC [bacterium]MBU3929284.1 arsenate reductase ArsC [bacterium]MBU4122235.1 arsenate reductase ArsC [bacterium]
MSVSKGLPISPKKVQFLCTGNSCRSQMAEGFLKHLGGDKFEAYSAGVNPTQVNPLSVKVMNEVGVDISGQRSKSVSEFLNQQFDYVITVCDNAKQTCPILPGECEKIHWNLEDPADAQGEDEERLIIFRKVRDEIKHKIEGFLYKK